MATTLRLKFGTMSGVKTWSFNNADTDVTSAQVKALADAMIANGDIYKYPPMTKESAEIVVTTTTPIDIS